MADNIPNSSPALSSSMEPQPGTAQCSITKKWFPEDELVTFQGQLVSAEGKQILLDRLQTGIKTPAPPTRPTWWNRLWCICLDWLLIFVSWSFIEQAITYEALRTRRHALEQTRAATTISGTALFLSLSVISFAYFTVLHAWKGKSLGKMAGKLRVVKLDGSPVSWARAAARSLATFGLLWVATGAVIFADMWPEIAMISAGLTIMLAWVWVLVDGLFALFDTRTQRSLHDRICGTRVIKEDL
ncbi:MAG: RDD family protein [Phycisphaerae bacterium]